MRTQCRECLYEKLWAVGQCCKKHGRRDCVVCPEPDSRPSQRRGDDFVGEWHLAEHCREHGLEGCEACDVDTDYIGELCPDHAKQEWLEGQAWKAEAARESDLI